MEQTISTNSLSPKCVPIDNLTINPDSHCSGPEPGNLCLCESLRNLHTFGIDPARWDSGRWRSWSFLVHGERLRERVIIQEYFPSMINPIGWRRDSVLDYVLSMRTFGCCQNFSVVN